jgi:hypothetical protein
MSDDEIEAALAEIDDPSERKAWLVQQYQLREITAEQLEAYIAIYDLGDA